MGTVWWPGLGWRHLLRFRIYLPGREPMVLSVPLNAFGSLAVCNGQGMENLIHTRSVSMLHQLFRVYRYQEEGERRVLGDGSRGVTRQWDAIPFCVGWTGGVLRGPSRNLLL